MSSRAADTILAGVLLGLSAFFFLETFSEVYQRTGVGTLNNAVFYPRLLLAALALLSLAMLAQAWLRGPGRIAEVRPFLLPVGSVLALTIGFAALFMTVPFLATGPVYCAAVALVLGYRRFVVLGTIAVGAPALIWAMFEQVLGIPLP